MDPIHRIVELDPRKKAFSLVEEFKNFAFKGNVIDLAVGVIIGAAFGKIIDSLVKQVMMPLILFVFIFKFLGWVMKAKKEEAVTPPPLTKDQELLTEIRDLLKKGAAPA